MQEEMTPEEQKVINQLSDSIARELASGTKKDSIVKKLVSQKWPEEGAVKFVDSVEVALNRFKESPEGRKIIANQYRRHIVYGSLWMAGGVIIIIVSYTSASGTGTFIAASAALIFGIVDFIRGLTGWLKYQKQA